MAQERPPLLSRGERGASLILVLIALAALTPLALILSDLVLLRQRQVGAHQYSVGGQAASRGGLDVAMARLQSRQIALNTGQSAEFELDEGPRALKVRVTREDDAVLGLDGTVYDPVEAAELDLGRLAIDPLRGAVREYRLIEVYVVEAESPARYPFAAVRLLAVVGRLEEGVICIGVRYDRGYFP